MKADKQTVGSKVVSWVRIIQSQTTPCQSEASWGLGNVRIFLQLVVQKNLVLTGDKFSATYIDLISINSIAKARMCNHTLCFYTKWRRIITNLGKSFVIWIKEHGCQFGEPVDIKDNMLQQVRTKKWYSSMQYLSKARMTPMCVYALIHARMLKRI